MSAANNHVRGPGAESCRCGLRWPCPMSAAPVSADVDALRAELTRTREVLSRRSAALGRVVGEKRTLEARLEKVEALHQPIYPTASDEVWGTNAECSCGSSSQCDTRRALDAPVPSWRVLCPHGGCADPDSCRDAVRADNEEDQ